MTRPRIPTTPLVVLVLAVALAACGSPPPVNPAGYVPEDVRNVDDPTPAIARRLAEAGPLLEALDAGGEASTGIDERIESLAREVAALSSSKDYDAWPVTRARLRTRILFLNEDDAKVRRRALEECRTSFAKLQQLVAAKGGRP